jgi:hypothetical protein
MPSLTDYTTLVVASPEDAWVTERVREAARERGISVLSAASDLGIAEPQVSWKTPREEATVTARLVTSQCRLPAISAASEFRVDSLSDYIKPPRTYPQKRIERSVVEFFDAVVRADLYHSKPRLPVPADAHGMMWLADHVFDLVGRLGPGDRDAEFHSVIGLAWPDGECEVFEGRVSGYMVWPAQGRSSDPFEAYFADAPASPALAEMSPEEYLARSPRGQAFSLFARRCLCSPGAG